MITVKTKNNPFTRMGDLLGSPRVASLEKSAPEKKKSFHVSKMKIQTIQCK
jgi:hypothetical protein